LDAVAVRSSAGSMPWGLSLRNIFLPQSFGQDGWRRRALVNGSVGIAPASFGNKLWGMPLQQIVRSTMGEDRFVGALVG
jgi:hypothetical protein